MSRIVSLGTASEDLFLIDRDDLANVGEGSESRFSGLNFGKKVDIDKAEFWVGGTGASAAVSFARCGHESIFIGNIGKDLAGEAVLECFDKENVDTSYIEILQGVTSTRVLLVDAKSGEHTELEYKGVSAKAGNLNADDLENLEPDWLYAGGLDGDFAKAEEFFDKAIELGAGILWAPSESEMKQPKKLLRLLRKVDVLVVNKAKAARLVPGVILTELLARLSNYCETVIITDGIMGAIATNGEETYRLGVYEQGRIRDLTGVGQAFGAGFLSNFAEVEDFGSALRFAAANAAKVAQKYGATNGLLTGEEELHPMPIVRIDDLSNWLEPGKEK